MIWAVINEWAFWLKDGDREKSRKAEGVLEHVMENGSEQDT